MSPALPDGERAPDDGTLPATVRDGASDRDFGVYLHVPFCTVRCGYCDFNTYTATELGGGASQDAYASTALREIALARDVMRRADLPDRPAATVFVGGGTPTVLPVADLARLLDGVREGAGVRIFIGAETRLFSLSGSAVIAAPYMTGSQRVLGAIGVIGPARLNYARIIPLVDYTARVLGQVMNA